MHRSLMVKTYHDNVEDVSILHGTGTTATHFTLDRHTQSLVLSVSYCYLVRSKGLIGNGTRHHITRHAHRGINETYTGMRSIASAVYYLDLDT